MERETDDALAGLINAAHSTQTATMPYVVERSGRITVGSCVTALTADWGKRLERPPYTMACSITPEGGARRRLQIFGTGSGLNTAYRGAVIGEQLRWDLSSQNASVMGTGYVRGFDIRARGAQIAQIAAVSFYEYGPLDARHNVTYVSRAWIMPQRSAADDDVLITAIALASALPRATLCDAGILTARGRAPAPSNNARSE